MARPRVIDQNDILDAAETVVARAGVVGLTLDAVAVEAGISKASVIYDFKSKNALINAVIERKVAEEEVKLRAEIDRLDGQPNAHLKAQLAIASESMPDDMRGVAMHLSAALAQDAELRGTVQEWVERQLSDIRSASPNPRLATIVYLAIEGLRAQEFLGFMNWTQAERSAVLKDIEMLLDACQVLDCQSSPSNARPDNPPSRSSR